MSILCLCGWCSAEKARLYDFVKETNPEKIVEFGVFGGRSFFPMAIALKDMGKGHIVGVNAWSKNAAVANYTPDDQNYRY